MLVHSASGRSSVGVRLMMPAQFTRMSTLPKRSSAAASSFSSDAPVAHIRGDAQRLPSARLNLFGGLVHLLLAARRGNYIGARIGQAKAQGPANARGASGHNRNLAFKAEQLRIHSISMGK